MNRPSSPSSGAPAATPEEVSDRLHTAAIRLLRRLRREDVGMGLGPARASALSVLVFAGPLALKDLAAAEQVTPPTMSRIVQGLEEGGLVRRSPDPLDARAVRLEPTRRGRRALDLGRRRRVAVLARRVRALDAADRRVLERAVAVLEDLWPSSDRHAAGRRAKR